MNQQLQIRARQIHHQLMRQQQDEYGKAEARPISKRLVEDFSTSSGAEHCELEKENDSLRVKLKTAAKYMGHLIREREHLIEMSNRLRGELNRIKCNVNYTSALITYKRKIL